MPTLLRPRTLPYAGLSVLVALALAGCGGGSSTTNGPAPVAGSTPATTGAGGTGGTGNGQRQPGTTGLIAAVNGSTMQVQTRTDQTAVTWSDTTAFTKQVVATLADVTTGSCVTVLEPQTTGSATATPGATAPTSVSAATVQVRPATNGQCTGGFGGFGGGGGGAGAPTGAPTRAGTRTGTAGPDGAGGAFGRRPTTGLVTAVSGSTITVQETMRGGAGAGGASTGSATTDGSTTGSGGTAEGTTQIVTVTTTGSTAYLAEKQASPSDVAVGECATATGKADDTGAVDATTVALRPAANGSCTNGGTGRPTGSATTGTANG